MQLGGYSQYAQGFLAQNHDFGPENKPVKSNINNAYGTLPIFIRLQGEAVSVVPAGGAA